jgi:hypothetical protein
LIFQYTSDIKLLSIKASKFKSQLFFAVNVAATFNAFSPRRRDDVPGKDHHKKMLVVSISAAAQAFCGPNRAQ